VRVTRLVVAAGIPLLGFLCWLAAIGFTAMVPLLVTVALLIFLVGGGNWLSDRSVVDREPRRLGTRVGADPEAGAESAARDPQGP
jgi:hypothetical protein